MAKYLVWHILSFTVMVSPLKFFEDANLTDEEFEKYPVVSTEERESEACEGVREVEEVRNVDGEEIRKLSIIDLSNLHTMLEDSKTQGQVEIWHRPFLNCLDQLDPRLADILEKDYVKEPDMTAEYNFTVEVVDLLEHAAGYDLPVDVDELVFGGNMKNGFFIEAGAGGGEEDSNSLYFELKHNWTGLLVEPMPCELMYKHRKAKISSTCLALEPRSHFVDFNHVATISDKETGAVSMAGIVPGSGQNTIKMQCMPLYSLIMAVGNPTVNWFILDIEGAEFQVLKTVPWDKVDIEVLSVETDLAGMVMEGSRQEIIELMESVGYTHRQHRVSWSSVNDVPKDDMFIRNDVARRIGLIVKEEL